MYVMAAGEIDQLLPAIEEAKAAGIMVMGVPPAKLAPFDAIMHTSQYEDGQKVAKMACDFIDAVYPDAADGSVETAIIGGASSSVGMFERDRGLFHDHRHLPQSQACHSTWIFPVIAFLSVRLPLRTL